MEIERITRSPTVPSHWPRHRPNAVPKDQKLSPNGIPNWMRNDSTQWLLRSQQIFYRSCVLMAKRSRPRMHWSYHPTGFYWEAVHRDPTWCRIKRCRKPHMESGFPRAEARSYSGEYDHLLWSLRVRYGSMIYCHPDAMGAFYYPQMVTSESHHNERLWQRQELKLTSSPKVTTRHRCNDVKTECIWTPHTTVSHQTEQVTTRHSFCNDVDIERIGTSHTTVSQKAEQVRIVTG